jgi:hypothetical protein
MKHILRENENIIREAENMYIAKQYDQVVLNN